MNENVFRRVEMKYILNDEELKKLFKIISPYIEKDEYYISHISNIYFDNNTNDMIVESLEKPSYKAKVRLRSYDKTPTLDSRVFLEIKEKYAGIVGKRRISLSLKEFDDYMNDGTIKDEQISKEIDYYFKKYDLSPSIYVSYDRLSYKADNSLRITVDSNLRSRTKDVSLLKNDETDEYFENDSYVLEIKILDAMPMWLTNALSTLHIYPVSFSKVGAIYTKNKLERSEQTC